MNDIYQSAMMRMRHNFAQKQQENLSQDEQKYIKGTKPVWWDNRCPANVNFSDYKRLFNEGELVWACIVMANNNLFDGTKTDDSPAMISYSRSVDKDNLATFVSHCAEQVYDFPNRPKSTLNEEEKKFHSIVSDQGFLGTEHKVPESISKDNNICINTLMVFRKHLPDLAIDFKYFPLIIHPFSTAVAMLPGFYWDDRLLNTI